MFEAQASGYATAMSSLLWKALSSLAGIAAAIVTRKGFSKLAGENQEVPPNPADRSVSWPQAAGWAVASAVGIGVSRLVTQRIAAAGWEKAVGSPPPGISTES